MPRIRKCDLNRERRRQEAYQLLHTAFPVAFPLDNAAIQPLALSTHNDLRDWLEAQPLTPKRRQIMMDAMRRHCSRVTYQKTAVAGAMRITLHGEPTEPVTAEGQAFAEHKIANILREREARAQREAEKEAAKAAKAQPKPKAKAKSAPKTKPAVVQAAPKPDAKPVEKAPVVVVKKRRRVVVPD